MTVFELMGKIAIENDQAMKAIDETNSSAQGLAGTLGNGIAKAAQGVGKAAVAVGKTVAAGAVAGAAAVGALAKSAVDAYADYEQLVGGVDTLFKDSSETVQGYADQAYKTAGMSANEYMETVTGFSASLLQSLGGDTAEAADIANRTIIDMADNANKMGSDLSAIQTTYAGFAKQNYTMLDNLKLGYGGTKEEMARLLADATELSGVEYDISSFADITEAIHVVQTELGITGTTAKEASSTIAGSLTSMKSSWQNLLTGIASGDMDMGSLIDNFVDSAVTAAQNLIPRIGEVLGGVGQLVAGLAPVLSEAAAQIIPMISETISAGLSMIGINIPAENITGAFQAAFSGISSVISGVVSTISSLLSAIDFQAVFGGLSTVASSVVGALSTVWNAVTTMISNIAAAFSGVDFGAIFSGLTGALSSVIGVIGDIIGAIVEIIGGMATAVANVIGNIIEQAQTSGTMINKIWTGITTSFNNAIDIIKGIIATITAIFKGDLKGAVEAGTGVVKDLAKTVGNTLQVTITWISGIIDGIGNTIKNIWGKIKDGAKEAGAAIKEVFKADWSFPKIKLPHFSISGKFSLDPPSIPKIAVEWYKKGAVLNRATAFGYNAISNKLMVGGEAGKEAVAPIDTLQGYVGEAVAEQVGEQQAAVIETMADAVNALSEKLQIEVDRIIENLNNVGIKMNNREFGRLVVQSGGGH